MLMYFRMAMNPGVPGCKLDQGRDRVGPNKQWPSGGMFIYTLPHSAPNLGSHHLYHSALTSETGYKYFKQLTFTLIVTVRCDLLVINMTKRY